MDEWEKLKADAANGGLWLVEVEPGRKTLIWHPDCPIWTRVIVPHANAHDLHYRQLVMRALDALRQLGGNRPDDDTVYAMHREPIRAERAPEPSKSRCSGKGNKD